MQKYWDELIFEEMNYGVPRPINIDGEKESVETSDFVTGTPGCRGVYDGPARVITKLEDAKLIQKARLSNETQ